MSLNLTRAALARYTFHAEARDGMGALSRPLALQNMAEERHLG